MLKWILALLPIVGCGAIDANRVLVHSQSSPNQAHHNDSAAREQALFERLHRQVSPDGFVERDLSTMAFDRGGVGR